jgi:hypothetical protein
LLMLMILLTTVLFCKSGYKDFERLKQSY